MRTMKRLATLLTVLALAVTAMPFAAAETAPAETAAADTTPAETNEAGKPYVLNVFAGTNLDLTQYQGKAIWLNFFTGWCTYCMKEMPEIKRVFDEFDPDQLAIVLIHVWDGENGDDSKSIIERFGLQDMIMVEDEEMQLAGMVGLQGYPTSFFIDKEGYLYGGTYTLDYSGMVEYMTGLGVGLRPEATATPAATSSENRDGSRYGKAFAVTADANGGVSLENFQ
ncbi:MAG: TlpA family protein disulfide reductase [Clostridiales bacterium]|nr:TlpA family protein disulfide reductase [Clostridiales bacterium]